MLKQIFRLINFSVFLIKNNGFNFNSLKAIIIWQVLHISKKIGIANKIRDEWKMLPLSLKIGNLKLIGRTGHIGLIEEVFFQRKINYDEKRDIVDCGSNIGFFALYINQKYKTNRVFCIEPDPANLVLLKSNVKQNKVNKIKIIESAIGNKKSICSFISTENGVGSYLGKSAVKKNEVLIKVKIDTLDNIVKENKITPGFIKIDVEGNEVPALLGAKMTLETFHPTLLIEIHKKGGYPIIEKYLKKFQYVSFEKMFGDTIICK